MHGRLMDVLAANPLAQALTPVLTPGTSLPDVDDLARTELVGELSVRSGHFRTLWSRHDVRPEHSRSTVFEHPQVGPLAGTPSAERRAFLASLASTPDSSAERTAPERKNHRTPS
ncbi:MmyB family transcriptional regulator [Streptomyces fuscichromogenes]|uniref:MmyB-like transcription regulator ligand binding domain-containing protein n=1 Tax=Streptomyces fuscichromogenes TaxID=1324013 RepID=A0A917XDN8_9ACTN|nr:hypothetical protein [Streptomyces fuscichromogenes]GGN12202.1 hypothetical protein GCM10011578_038890 [Streptomyces fuscichromogenes]